jgi:hypothetical protein
MWRMDRILGYTFLVCFPRFSLLGVRVANFFVPLSLEQKKGREAKDLEWK